MDTEKDVTHPNQLPRKSKKSNMSAGGLRRSGTTDNASGKNKSLFIFGV
jgi:hypothetical protein